MKVSKSWLKDLIDLKVSFEELELLLPLRTIGTKEVTSDFIELDMKGYNRADLLSLRGVAYEVSAISDSKVNFKDLNENELNWSEQNLPKLNVDIENPQVCPIYCLVKIEGLKVDKSNPDWVKKLSDSGMRSINNIADITNLAMLEYGQPFHAFDVSKVKDETIIVRAAKDGEKLITLDGKTRNLDKDDLLITDSQKILGLAGVMGGKDSEISDSTESILLEAAIFDPITIRKTASRLGLSSEASKRFQHGLTKVNLLQALDKAIKMYQDLGGKLTGLTIVGDFEDQIKKITLNYQKTNNLIGIELSVEDIENFLTKLNYKLSKTDSGWEVEPPFYRLDINIEEDVIEEIARMYGYEKIPSKALKGEIPTPANQRSFEFIYNLTQSLVKYGFGEVQTYSFITTKLLDLGFQKREESIKIKNPISSETEYLRSWLTPNLLEVIDKNLRLDPNLNQINIFEIGKGYELGKDKQPSESYKLAMAITSDDDLKLSQLNQVFQEVLKQLNISGVEIKPKTPDENIKHLFHPKRFADISYQGKDIGGISEIHPRILDQLEIKKRVAALEIDLESFIKPQE